MATTTLPPNPSLYSLGSFQSFNDLNASLPSGMTTEQTYSTMTQDGDLDDGRARSGSEQYASDDHSKNALDRLGFTKFLSSEKKTRDGNTPKRRGPKPDSKPALTRRQELNRQAQRTHRERKEMYIKALEAEVLRLKEVYGDAAKEREAANRERDSMSAEIRRLRDILNAHGIAYESPQLQQSYQSSYAPSSTGSHVGSSSYNAGSASTGFTSPPQLPIQNTASPPAATPMAPAQGINLDQVGIDFVLADSEADISGHAMMASCPPESHITNHPNEPYPHKMPDMGMDDLLKLLDLSNRLPLDGEITPVMAWAGIYSHPRRNELTSKDFETLKNDLGAKVRCYGFGAVLEEFEVKDALSNALASKDTMSVEELAEQFSDVQQIKGPPLYAAG